MTLVDNFLLVLSQCDEVRSLGVYPGSAYVQGCSAACESYIYFLRFFPTFKSANDPVHVASLVEILGD